MPTHDEDPQFIREYLALSLDRQRAFRRALRLMVEDMKNKRPFRPILRVKGVQGHVGIYEMTWEMPHGRATLSVWSRAHPWRAAHHLAAHLAAHRRA
jgi:hypothetical protein